MIAECEQESRRCSIVALTSDLQELDLVSRLAKKVGLFHPFSPPRFLITWNFFFAVTQHFTAVTATATTDRRFKSRERVDRKGEFQLA